MIQIYQKKSVIITIYHIQGQIYSVKFNNKILRSNSSKFFYSAFHLLYSGCVHFTCDQIQNFAVICNIEITNYITYLQNISKISAH